MQRIRRMGRFAVEALDRLIKSFLQGFVLVMVGSEFFARALSDGTVDVGVGKRALVSAIAGGILAVLSGGTSLVSRKVGSGDNAIALPIETPE